MEFEVKNRKNIRGRSAPTILLLVQGMIFYKKLNYVDET